MLRCIVSDINKNFYINTGPIFLSSFFETTNRPNKLLIRPIMIITVN